MRNEKGLFRRWLNGQVDWSAMLEQDTPAATTAAAETVPYHPHHDMASARRAIRCGQKAYTVLAIVLCLIFSAFMLLTVANLPSYGSDRAPTVNEVAERYV